MSYKQAVRARVRQLEAEIDREKTLCHDALMAGDPVAKRHAANVLALARENWYRIRYLTGESHSSGPTVGDDMCHCEKYPVEPGAGCPECSGNTGKGRELQAMAMHPMRRHHRTEGG
jgi:hypothetical protein